jgi:hypothetical protein
MAEENQPQLRRSYLKVAKLPVGLIINFKHAKLEFERIVLSTADRRR